MSGFMSGLGGMAVLVYFFIVIVVPVLLILSPILIWLAIRRCAVALERIAAGVEKFAPRKMSVATPDWIAGPPPVRK